MASIFTRIIQGEIPCHKVFEDDRTFCFMDIRPISRGHVLVVPKVEIDDFFDLEDATLQDLIVVAKKVAQAIEQAVSCQRVGVLVAGLEVPHAHLHLVPISGEGELTFARARPADPEELARVAASIREHLAS